MLRLIAVAGLLLCAAVAPAEPPKNKGSKIVGGAFDPTFQERAPEGGLLIGFEVSLGKFVDRGVIRSLRPIYRTAEGEETRGKQYGTPQGKVYTARAKAGYALGGVSIRTGLLIDGFSLTFMKIDGDQLDPDDAYRTIWLGNQVGGSPSTLGGDGSPVVGFSVRTKTDNSQCSGFGLILK
jgi:serine protease Do